MDFPRCWFAAISKKSLKSCVWGRRCLSLIAGAMNSQQRALAHLCASRWIKGLEWWREEGELGGISVGGVAAVRTWRLATRSNRGTYTRCRACVRVCVLVAPKIISCSILQWLDNRDKEAACEAVWGNWVARSSKRRDTTGDRLPTQHNFTSFGGILFIAYFWTSAFFVTFEICRAMRQSAIALFCLFVLKFLDFISCCCWFSCRLLNSSVVGNIKRKRSKEKARWDRWYIARLGSCQGDVAVLFL